jgi:RND family efflux transporter MFP subunit
MKNIFKLLILSIFLNSCEKSLKSTENKNDFKSVNLLKEIKEEKLNAIEKIKNEIDIINNKLDNSLKNKNIPVVSKINVKSSIFKHYAEFQGSVKTNKNILVYPESPGILKKLYVTKGEFVKKGKLIAELDNEILNSQLEQLKIQSNLLKNIFDRKKRLWDKKIGSEIDFLESKAKYLTSKEKIKELKASIKRTKIYAQFSGNIDDIITKIGSNVNPGITPIFRLINIDEVYIESEIPERHIQNINEQSEVKIYIPTLDESIASKVSQVGNFINPANRSFKIEVKFKNTNKVLKPNMTVKILVNDYTNQNAILIPIKNILENSEGDSYVFKILNSNKTFKTKKEFITLGKVKGNLVEVISGLNSNDVIVEDGLRFIKDDQIINIIETSEIEK